MTGGDQPAHVQEWTQLAEYTRKPCAKLKNDHSFQIIVSYFCSGTYILIYYVCGIETRRLKLESLHRHNE